MGKRLGVTKSGRIMNPADRERKQMRLKELKRNKKERVKIRQAIVKSRDPEELIEHLRRLDDQEFDLDNGLSLNVITDKRTKYKGAFIQMIALYRQEKDDKQVKLLENMLHDYELERSQKEQHYKAELFSKSMDPDEIPLPSGVMAPNAALTPFAPPPVAPQFHPTMKAGILKKPSHKTTKKHKYPPGPPCGLPQPFDGDENYENSDKGGAKESSRESRRVRFTDNDEDEGDDEIDYGPVEMPETMLGSDEPSSQPVYSRGPTDAVIPPPSSLLHIPTGIPPSMPFQMQQQYHQPPPQGYSAPPGNYGHLPPPQMLLQHPGNNKQPPRGGGSGRSDPHTEPNASAVISAAPQVHKAPPSAIGPVITAAPQMRNIKKEATRFVPSSLQVHRPSPVVRKPMGVGGGGITGGYHMQKSSNSKSNAAPAKSTDEACDEFLREIQDLL